MMRARARASCFLLELLWNGPGGLPYGTVIMRMVWVVSIYSKFTYRYNYRIRGQLSLDSSARQDKYILKNSQVQLVTYMCIYIYMIFNIDLHVLVHWPYIQVRTTPNPQRSKTDHQDSGSGSLEDPKTIPKGPKYPAIRSLGFPY